MKFKTMSTEMMAYLWIAIEHGQSMLVCGGTASGKTTTLNAVLLFIPPQMKIVSIEDTRELNLPHENWIPGLTREGFGGKSHDHRHILASSGFFDRLIRAIISSRWSSAIFSPSRICALSSAFLSSKRVLLRTISRLWCKK